MDTFFWNTLVTDVVNDLVIVVLGSVAALLILKFYFRLKMKSADQKTPEPLPQQKEEASEARKITLPLRLQAYERIVLFLERIQPTSLVLRVQRPEMGLQELQLALVKTIREEFEYNLSQQVYISPRAWELVRNAREESISVVNRASGQLTAEADAQALVRTIFEISVTNEEPAIQTALAVIKAEAMELL